MLYIHKQRIFVSILLKTSNTNEKPHCLILHINVSRNQLHRDLLRAMKYLRIFKKEQTSSRKKLKKENIWTKKFIIIEELQGLHCINKKIKSNFKIKGIKK